MEITRRKFAAMPLVAATNAPVRLRAIAAEFLPGERWMYINAWPGSIVECRIYGLSKERVFVFGSLEERVRFWEGKWDHATSLAIYQVSPGVES